MTPHVVECPNCRGTGRISQFICYSVYDHRPIRFDVSCTLCQGTGRLRSGTNKAKKVMEVKRD